MRKTSLGRFKSMLVCACAVAGVSLLAMSGCVFSDTITQRVYDNEETSEVDETVAPMLINNINATTENDTLPQLVNDPDGASASETSKQIPIYVEDPSKSQTDEPAARPVYSKSAQKAGQASILAEEEPEEETDTEQNSGDTTKQKSEEGTKTKKGNKGNKDKGKSGKNSNKGKNKKDKGKTKDDDDDKSDDGNKDSETGAGKGDGTGATYNGDENETPEIPGNIDEVAAVGNNAVIVSMLSGSDNATALKACDSYTKKATSDLLKKRGIAKSVAVWDNDGSSSGDLSSSGMKKLTTEENIPDLVFITEGDDTLSNRQVTALKQSNVDIYYLPALTSAKRIRFAVEVIGKVLDKGGVSGVKDRYEAYLDFESDIVSKYSGRNGGVTGGYDFGTRRSTGAASQTVVSLLIDNWDSDARNSETYLNTSSGVATATLGFEYSPVSYYMSEGGVLNNASSATFRKAMDGDGGIVWQFRSNARAYRFGNWSGLETATYDLSDLSAAGTFTRNLLCYTVVNGDGTYVGLGSSKGDISFPAVIAKSEQIKSRFENASKSSGQLYYSYEAIRDGSSTTIGLDTGSQILDACIGNNGSDTPSASYDVYVNPKGLVQESADDVLCSWTDGSVESVLEASWAYWRFRGGSSSDFDSDVKNFYDTFYGYSLSSSELSSIKNGPSK